MKRILLAILAILVAAPLAARSEPAILYFGGPIVTMQGDTPETVEAVLVRGGRIVLAGSRAAAEQQAGSGVTRVDLHGHTMLPGFIDAHGHVTYAGQAEAMAKLAPPPVGGVDSLAKLQAALRDWIAKEKAGATGPIVGNGYDDLQLAEKRHPTRQDLDAVSVTRPIILLHASGHFAALNSAALRLVGYGPETPDPQGGVIRREADGKTPNGVLEETAVHPLIAKVMPSTVSIDALVAGQKLYVANGVTTAQDGRVMPEQWPSLAEAARRGTLPIDTVVLIAFEREWPEAVRAQIGKPYVGRVRIGGVKLTIDGSPQGRTAWLHDPVPVPPAGKNADYRGYPAIENGLFRRRLYEAASNHWQVFVHVNGDEAMQSLIEGVRAEGLAGRRTIALHAQVVRPEQLTEMAELDIQPSFFASHTWFWGDWHRDVALGPKRADFISPQASAWAAGLRPSAHNDSPVVPPDIMRLLWSSVNRRTQSGDILGPLERISVYRALQQVTINAAWQIFEDGEKGSIAVGKRADFVVLDQNPLTTDPAQLFAIRVLATIKDGKTVFGLTE